MKNVSVSLKVRTKSAGLVSRLKLDKKGISDTAIASIVKEVKAIADPKKFEKGGDRGQIVIKVDGKAVFAQKFSRIKAAFNLFTPGIISAPVIAKKATVAKTAVKKPVIKNKK